MIHINVKGRKITAISDEPLVAKCVGTVMFDAEFDASWEGYRLKIVFSGAAGDAAVLYTGGVMEVPWQAMDERGLFRISAVGLAEGKREVTAKMDNALYINPNGSLGEDPADPGNGQTILEQTQLKCMQAVDDARDAQKQAEDMANAALIRRNEAEQFAAQTGEYAKATQLSMERALEAERNAQGFAGQAMEGAAGAMVAREGAEDAERRAGDREAGAGVSANKAKEEADRAAQEKLLAKEAEENAVQQANAAGRARAGAEQALAETKTAGANLVADAKRIVGEVKPDIDKLYAALIRDTLTGYVVQGEFVEGTPLDYRIDIKAVQEGEGDPSPENVRAISGVDAVSLAECGKNICEYYTSVEVGHDFSICLFAKVNLQPETEYVITFTGAKDNRIYFNENIFHLKEITCSGDRQSVVIKTLERIEKSKMSIPIFKNMEGNTVISNFTEFQIELGTVATEIVPYKGTTHAIALPETSYGGYIDYKRRKYVATHCLETILPKKYYITTGRHTSGGKSFYYQVLLKNMASKGSLPISNMYISSVWNTNSGSVYIPNQKNCTFLDDRFTTKEEVVAWLNDNQVSVLYELETPIEYDLADLPQLTALNGKTTIYSDAKEVSITGYMDTKSYIEKKLAELTALTLEV